MKDPIEQLIDRYFEVKNDNRIPNDSMRLTILLGAMIEIRDENKHNCSHPLTDIEFSNNRQVGCLKCGITF